MSQTIPSETPSNTTPPLAPQPHVESLLTSAGLASLAGTAWIAITGPDRVRWLNGMVTNSIGDLAPGAGCYNFLLNAQGRIQGDAHIFAEPDRLLLETSASQIPTLSTLLDRFIIMDDVELSPAASDRKGLLLAGPHAPEILRDLDLLQPDILPPPGAAPTFTHLLWQSHPLTVLHAYSPLVPRFEIWAHEPALSTIAAELLSRGAVHSSPAAVDLLRILEGTPLFGVDIRDRDLPQETGAARALHFSKGCYLGQEIVERIRSRGQVHRIFGGFHLHGAPAIPGAALFSDDTPDKPIGELTSVAAIHLHAGPVQLALGYIRREALALAKPLRYSGGTAEPVSLPFHPAKNP